MGNALGEVAWSDFVFDADLSSVGSSWSDESHGMTIDELLGNCGETSSTGGGSVSMMHQKVELHVSLDELAKEFRPDHVPPDAKVYALPWEGGSQRDPETMGIRLIWDWDDRPASDKT